MRISLYILAVLFLASCTPKDKLPPDAVVVYWKGKSTLIVIKDSLGKENYQPVYLKNNNNEK